MQHLMIFSSPDLERRIVSALADASSIRAIVEVLEGYAESCETRPCLRLVVTPVEMTSADAVRG